MKRDLRTLPKAHLHLHVGGAIRPNTLRELGDRYRLPPVPQLPGDARRTWDQFQAHYDATRGAIRTTGDLARVITEAAAHDAANGCGWLEIQIDPTGYAPTMGGLRPVLEAALAAAAAAPIPARIIVASSWARPGEHALRLAGLAAHYADSGVTGFGLSNDERRGNPADFLAAFAVAADAGLTRTPHAGFYLGSEHVRDCVELLGATRIGHGTAAAADPATMALLAERGIALEVCPTSYPPFGVHELAEVPVARLLAAGVPVAIASDDPLLFDTDLLGQYEICRDTLGLSDAVIATLAEHGVRHSAAPPPVKVALLAGIDAWRQGTLSG